MSMEASGPQAEARIAKDAGVFWEASQGHGTIQDLSHWLGVGRWADEASWRSIGQRHFGLYRRLRELSEVQDPFVRMVEWGPGGGSNAVAFAGEVEEFIGVDISLANLVECETRLRDCHGARFRGIHIPVHDPEAVLQRVREPVDFFLCTAVYQHFPSQAYGERITRVARQMLRPGGLALIQTRFDDGSLQFGCKDRDYLRNAVTFTSYDLEAFGQLAERCGLRVHHVDLEITTRYAFYLLQAMDD